ncbi:transposase [Streptomyces kebangsaanensis]|uniref:Transposase n=1 Tax=Streptomyces kebangsaanensis TaxID=864058 RepID=A0ABW6KTB2_9ACTN
MRVIAELQVELKQVWSELAEVRAENSQLRFENAVVACTTQLTWYRAHARHGCAAVIRAGAPEHCTGTFVADVFTCYQRYGTARALCSAHLLRGLDGIHHTGPARQVWAKAAAVALAEVNTACEQARQAGEPAVGPEVVRELLRRFDSAVACGKAADPHQPDTKKAFAGQATDRTARHREDIVRFLHDLAAPFTSNRGEQDIRTVKIWMT